MTGHEPGRMTGHEPGRMRYVYILRSTRSPKRLYVGVSSSPERRVIEHNQSKCDSTKRFRPWEIVYLEQFENKMAAFQREKQIKKWSRGKKEALIAGEAQMLKELSACRNK